MDRKVRVAQYGCGKMSIPTMKYLYEHGGEVVCAFAKTDRVVGKDIGELLGTENKGVIINYGTEARRILEETKPDVCIVETMAILPDVEDILLLCAELGIDVLTTNEEAFYPWNSRPKMTKKIDELAKKNGCTIVGTGAQDMSWGTILTTVMGASSKVTKVYGKLVNNSEDYGIALSRVYGVGYSMDQFEKEIVVPNTIRDEERLERLEKEDFNPCYVWNSNGWLASALDLTVTKQEQTYTPIVLDKPIYSEVLQETIPAGNATGLCSKAVTETAEGITIEVDCIARVYEPGEEDVFAWKIYGDPDQEVILAKPDTVAVTCATLVNRIPDVMNSEPGFITTDKMAPAQYRPKPLNEYVK